MLRLSKMPKTSNTHVRDAIGAGIFGALRVMSERAAPPKVTIRETT